MFADPNKQKKWMPVDLYSGGAEHTTMHLLYSRFWHKALFDLGLVADSEPYTRRMNRSIILGPDNQKMSKSRGNVIDPDEVVKQLGADTVRMYLAFIGPYGEVGSYPWNPDGVVGVRRFLERVWRLQGILNGKSAEQLAPIFHKSIKKIGEDIKAFKFNTAISQLMILLNAIEKTGEIRSNEWEIFLLLLAPFAPHMAEALWQEVKESPSIHREPWPEYDEAKTCEKTLNIAVQVNGKTRAEIQVETDADTSAIEKKARSAVEKHIDDKEVARVVVVPGRLVNFVVRD